MFNRKFSSNIRRRKRMVISSLILLVVFLTIGYSAFTSNLSINGTLGVSKYVDTILYNVFETAAQNGYVQKYTGDHKDSFTEEPSKNIYYWSEDTSVTEDWVADHNNVVFANSCWEMFRTTDTGGVKLLYGGPAKKPINLYDRDFYQNVNISSPDDSHNFEFNEEKKMWRAVGKDNVSYMHNINFSVSNPGDYVIEYNVSMPENVYMKIYKNSTQVSALSGNDYNTYKLTGLTTSDVIKVTIFMNNSNNDYMLEFGIGKEMQNSLDFTCKNNSWAKLIDLSRYNSSPSSPANVGYMYNELNDLTAKSNSKKTYTKEKELNAEFIVNPDLTYDSYYAFGKDIEYNQSSSVYFLKEYYYGTWEQWLNEQNTDGLYLCISSSTGACSEVMYITGITDAFLSGYIFKDGKFLSDYDKEYIFGNGFTYNSGEYTLTNTITIKTSEWKDRKDSLKGLYTCGNETSTCQDIQYVVSADSNSYEYTTSSDAIKIANSVSYENDKYTLNNAVEIWSYNDEEINVINNNHYTCFNNTDECSKVAYITNYGEDIYYFELENGTRIEDAIEKMINSDDINKDDSSIKKVIDKWYETNLINYTNYLEDTIFCNDRSIKALNGWNPNGGNVKANLLFNSYNNNTIDFSCTNTTDMFSVSNPKAKLKYPIALQTNSEKLIKKKALYNRDYWTMTPSHYSNVYAYMNEGILWATTIATRPVISLKPGTEYSSGTGSMADPYIVEVPMGVLTIRYIDENGAEIHEPFEVQLPKGASFNYVNPTISGYEPDTPNATGTINGSYQTKVVVYHDTSTPIID